MPRAVDEETPLLGDPPQHTPRNGLPRQKTPLPWFQFSIVLLLQVAEPLTVQVIAPFLPQLIRDIGITRGDDSLIAYYAGLMHSLFFLTEACTILHWSRMSDQIGRKPVILTGLFGLSASMWFFGLSKTFLALVLSRCLCGALNGNTGIMKGMVAEITDSTNVAQAYGILPLAWCFGNTLGPLIGGSLARPVDRFPGIFGRSAFLKKYPYFLPCSVAACFTALSWLISFLFLKETMEPQMSLRQYMFGGMSKDKTKLYLQPHGIVRDNAVSQAAEKPLPLRAVLTRPVIIAAGSYATFCLIEMAFRAIVPVFYAAPIAIGGLDLDPRTIGNILAIFGISSGVIRAFLFAPVHGWLGSKRLFLVSVSACFPMIALFPLINAAARAYGVGQLVWFLVGLQLAFFIFACFSFGVTFMYINAAAPDKAIGATNGIAQMVASLMRAVGPAAASSAYSLGIEKNIMGGHLGYWVMAVMVCLALRAGSLLPRHMHTE